MKNLFDHIDTAKQFAAQGGSTTESLACAANEKTQFALKVVQHFAESKPEEPKPIQLGAQPIAN